MSNSDNFFSKTFHVFSHENLQTINQNVVNNFANLFFVVGNENNSIF